MGLCQTKPKLNLRTSSTEGRWSNSPAALIKDSSVINDLDISRYNGVPILKPPPLRRESPSDYEIDAVHRLIGYNPELTYLSPLERCEISHSSEPV